MGRPEPCVLFAQTFVHAQLDEYVDEVIFAEPIIITACEILEHNSSSASPSVTLVGATLPPSFALEFFVHCEGETTFRRLCQPFLYSHSSSNVLESETVVTSHLVVRGSYRSLSLVIYGNTAEDLGQFNIEVDLDSTLTNTVSAVEGNLEDLPPFLHPAKVTIEESISPLKALSLDIVEYDISAEMKLLLQLSFKMLEMPNLGNAVTTVVNSIVSVASTYATHSLHSASILEKQLTVGKSLSCEESSIDLTEVTKKLLGIYSSLLHTSGNLSAEFSSDNTFLESEADLATSKLLVEIFEQYFSFCGNFENIVHPLLSKSKVVMLWLSAALLLCSSRESCFHFVNSGGMQQLEYVFRNSVHTAAITLILLGVLEQVTRHSIGCEGFLGWWPREDEKIPSGVSELYNQLLKLLLQKQRHDVASLASYILHRTRVYEVASRYECAVLSVLEGISAVGKATTVNVDMLACAKLQLKKLFKLINSSGPIEDPSPVASATRSLILGEAEGLLSYKATSRLITLSTCGFSDWDIDSSLLFLLKERGFLPLSAALLSSSILRSEAGQVMDLFVDITSYIEAIILSLLFCRSGLVFLLLDPELATTVVLALRGADSRKQESIPLRYASILISKGFVCHPCEVGMIIETHLRVVNVIDRLITAKPHSENLLWALWELCCISRSDCGRQALLAVGHFSEAVSVLIAALHSVKELDAVSMNTGVSPLNLAIFHSAVEIFEVIVTDSTASSLGSWIGHAKELHKALHSSSPGSNRKDAPTRLLEWIDGAVVYHRNGVIGLLRYAAVLASGGDAHMASTNILASEAMDVENAVGDASSSSDGNIIDNLLGKPIKESRFLGVTLRDSSVAQLTTAFRILAFISENSVVAAALYDEGAVMVIQAVVIDCKMMLERSSNNYDYLVDEGTECNTTSDLLLERNREQSIIDLLIPSLLILINLLKRLQETKEQHRNTKLLKALLQLHRELSPKLAACAADLSYPYPDFALGCQAVCHLLTSVLACWPAYGWTPSLFHFLLDSLYATSLLAMGPKETCSLLLLLNDLLPEQGASLWKNGLPMLSALRQLAIGTLLGLQKEREINWYLQPGHAGKLLGQLTPSLLHRIAETVLHCAISTLIVVQDMLRLFVVRMAYLDSDSASILLRPLMLWIGDHLSDLSTLSDADAYKVYRLLDFLSVLLEHPRAKPILLNEGAQQIFLKVLENSGDISNPDSRLFSESRNDALSGFSQLSWCIPVLRSISLICDSRTSPQSRGYDRFSSKSLTTEDYSLLLFHLLRLCKVLPFGAELAACLSAFKDLGSSIEGRSAFVSIFMHKQSSSGGESEFESRSQNDRKLDLFNIFEFKKHPPLLCCWITLLSSIGPEDILPEFAIEAVGALSSGALSFCMDGKSLNLDRIGAVKYLFGLPNDIGGSDDSLEGNINYIRELITLLGSRISGNEYSDVSAVKSILSEVTESAKSLLLLLENTTGSVKADEVISSRGFLVPDDIPGSSKIRKIANSSVDRRVEQYTLTGFGDKFMWECPENLQDRFSQTALPLKRKIPSLDGANRRPRGDNSPSEAMPPNAFSRGSGSFTVPSGPTRRDTFRLRKPNTSRPPSMHVDDYVARERNVDGTTSSNVISVPRLGPNSSGRPPSIHVDEFMARERERQNPASITLNTQVKVTPPENDTDAEKFSKSKRVGPDLDDDLQGVNIVFGGEESESDDGLLFPQPDDNLQPGSVIVEHSSPRSIVEDTESDVNGSNVDENNRTQSEFSSRMSFSERPLTREPSISSDKKYMEQSEEGKDGPVKTSSLFDSAKVASSSGFSSSAYNKSSGPTVQSSGGMPPLNLYPKASLQQRTGVSLPVGSQEFYEKKFQVAQPPLPPMPPPPTISPILSKTPDPVSSQPSPFVNSMQDVHPPLPPGFHVQADYLSALSNSSAAPASSALLPESKYARTSFSSPGGSARPQPPLPPTPPPYAATSQSSVYNLASVAPTDHSQSFAPAIDVRLGKLSASGTILTSYPPPPLMPPLLFSRPSSIPFNLYTTSPSPHQGEIPSSMSQSFPISLSSIQSLQSVTQLQPLQPPQLPRPPQPPQHLRPPIPASPQSEHGVSLLQSPSQMQVQQLQMLQPTQSSPAHVYYQSLQQENFPQTQQQQRIDGQSQVLHQQGHGTPQVQDDGGMSLQHFFSSPEAIQSLLSDRDKLCQLLEQHPKLMQMLQERLGQL